jgi:hypothetical protein
MKKFFLIGTFLIAGFIGTNAQEGFRFGAGPRLALPLGTFGDFYSFGAGVDVEAEYGFSEKFSGVFTTGYTNFFGKSGIDAVGYVPFLAGVRVYPSTGFFIGAQVGYGLLTGNGSSGAFNYQPQVGYTADNYQLALNYNSLSKNGGSTSHIALTGIYKFGGNK